VRNNVLGAGFPSRLLLLVFASLICLLAVESVWAFKPRVQREPEARYLREVWLDTDRLRHVNVRIALPLKSALPPADRAMPVLLFSAPQGYRWGGYADNYEDLSQEMLKRGVVTVTVAHYDIDEPMGPNERFSDVYPGILTGKRHDPAVDRYEDWLFVLRELQTRNQRRLDAWPTLNLDRLAVAGHSSGTLTALHLAGLPVRDRQGTAVAKHDDPRIKAFVVYSYPLEYRGPSRADLQQVNAVAGLHVAGVDDHPQFRQTAFRHLRKAPQHWLVADGGHNIGATGSVDLVLEVTGTFIDAYVNEQPQQARRLTASSFQNFKPDFKLFASKPAMSYVAPDHRDLAVWARDLLPWGRWLHDRAISHARSSGGVPR
jgi:hypothetical protein